MKFYDNIILWKRAILYNDYFYFRYFKYILLIILLYFHLSNILNSDFHL